MGRAYPEKAIVEGFPTYRAYRAKVDGTRVQSSPRHTLNSSAVQQQTPSRPTENSLRAHFIRQLEECVDGNQVHFTAHIRDDVSSVEIFYEACLSVFQQLWELIIGSETPFTSKQRSILRESLGRMVLWSDSLGHGQLDSILERSDSLKESVLECLVGIAEIIVKEFTPLLSIGAGNPRLLKEIGELTLMNEKARLMNSEDYDSDLESTCSDEDTTGGQGPKFPFLQDIAFFSECLMDLLPGLERISRVQQQTPMKYIVPSPVFQVSEPASPFVSLVLDKFRKANPRLAQRLGEANWQRYVRIRAKIGANDEDEHAHTDSVIPCSVFNPVSLSRDPGVGTTVAVSSNYAMSTDSHTSFVSSLADINNSSLRVPDEPVEVALRKPFTCAICGHKLYNIKTRIDWKVHVYADLQPYICTWPDCKAELMTFATRKQWANHEFEQHRVERLWRCQECSAELPSLEDWRNHISKAHPNAVPSRSRLGVSAQLAENSRPTDVVDMSCPLCLKKIGPSRRAFATHVGKHMEQLALAALPKGWSDESEPYNVSIRTASSESRQMGDGLSSKSQAKSEFRLSSDHQHPSPHDYKSLHIEYSSAGGLCTEQEFSQKLRALEQQNVIRGQEVFTDTLSRESPYRAPSPLALEKHKPQKFRCSFCDAQPQGKHELRKHLATKHISGPPLYYMAEIDSEQSGLDFAAIIKCICGFQENDDQGIVVCEQCKTWQHGACYYYREEGMPLFLNPIHKCADCEPRELDAKGAAERMNKKRRQGFGVQHHNSPTSPDYWDPSHYRSPVDAQEGLFYHSLSDVFSVPASKVSQAEVPSSDTDYLKNLGKHRPNMEQGSEFVQSDSAATGSIEMPTISGFSPFIFPHTPLWFDHDQIEQMGPEQSSVEPLEEFIQVSDSSASRLEQHQVTSQPFDTQEQSPYKRQNQIGGQIAKRPNPSKQQGRRDSAEMVDKKEPFG